MPKVTAKSEILPTNKVASNLVRIDAVDEMQQSYLEYSLANIARAIPSAFDGLLTVQRRILFTAFREGFHSHKPYVKAAKLEGNVMGLVHPHSGSFGSIVQLANTWNNLQNLLDGWGNYGDATSNAASARYVEIRLASYS
jgi:DNA gyrase subunit A